ncbi:hypothetical protein C8R44DRAFT_992626 [Mycena epipterygia]|nr:hypothetical protein C8R44DRAFT_992857 [Mycena epipterygia]KAJ7079180.1 hypothetical protein C8R44DRAFT_992626 [Mycena epipterygia]
MSSPSRPASRPPNSPHTICALCAHVTLPCARCQVTIRYRCPYTPILRRLRPHLNHAPASPAPTGASPPCPKRPVRSGDSCAGHTQFDPSFKRGADADNVGVNGESGALDLHAGVRDRNPVCAGDRAPDWHDIFVRGLHKITSPSAHSHSTGLRPSLLLDHDFLPSASTSAHSPPRVRILPSLLLERDFLPPGSASAYAFDTPSHNEQCFLLRSDISRTSAGTAPSTNAPGRAPATSSPGRAALPPSA